VTHPKAQAALAPQRKQRLIVRNRKVVAARIKHPGQPDSIERAEERPCAFDLFRKGRPRQPVEQIADGAVVAAKPAGRLAGIIALGGEAGGKLLIICNAKRVGAAGIKQHAAVKLLDVDVMLRCGGNDLGLRRPAILRKLPLAPATGHHKPRSLGRGGGLVAKARKRLGKRSHADPMNFGLVGQTGTNGMDM